MRLHSQSYNLINLRIQNYKLRIVNFFQNLVRFCFYVEQIFIILFNWRNITVACKNMGFELEHNKKQKTKNPNFLISLQPDGVNLCDFKHRKLVLIEFIV